MLFSLKLYGAVLAAFFVLDLLWLGFVARSFYQQHLGYLLAPSTNWAAALVFYLLYCAGLLVFVVLPGLARLSLKATALRAAFFGLIAYAAYDLTNLATVRDWPALLSWVDMAWGTLLSVLASIVGFGVGKWEAARSYQGLFRSER